MIYFCFEITSVHIYFVDIFGLLHMLGESPDKSCEIFHIIEICFCRYLLHYDDYWSGHWLRAGRSTFTTLHGFLDGRSTDVRKCMLYYVNFSPKLCFIHTFR